MKALGSLLLGLTLVAASIGCQSSSPPVAGTGKATPAAKASAAKTPAKVATPKDTTNKGTTKTAATKAKRIVFVGKAKACDCTRKAVDAGWAALQQALGKPAKLPVERLELDTHAQKVAPYRQQKALMTLPGIYFLDEKGKVLALLQGEVAAQKIMSTLWSL